MEALNKKVRIVRMYVRKVSIIAILFALAYLCVSPMLPFTTVSAVQGRIGPQKMPILKWHFPNDAKWDRFSSPVVGRDGTVYIKAVCSTKSHSKKRPDIAVSPGYAWFETWSTTESSSYLFALGPDGVPKWKYEISQETSKPAIGLDGTIYSIKGYENVEVFDSNGTVKWEYCIAKDAYGYANGYIESTISPVIAEDGTGYVIVYTMDSWQLHAFMSPGKLKWKYENAFRKGVPHGLKIALGQGDTAFVVESGYINALQSVPTTVYAILPDGSLKWKIELPHWLSFVSDPVVSHDGTIYLALDDNCLYALNPDGSVKWKFETSISKLDKFAYGPAVGFDGTVFVGYYTKSEPTTTIACALTSQGSIKWQYELDWPPVGNDIAIGADDVLYISSGPYASQDIYVCALSPDGKLKWKYAGEGTKLTLGPDGILYMVSKDGLGAFHD